MRKVRLICVGKTHDQYLIEGISQYLKKINKYCEIEIDTVKEADFGTLSLIKGQEVETKNIEKKLGKNSFIISCDERGRQFSSLKLTGEIQKLMNRGFSSFDFIIGGAYGLSAGIKEKSNLLISLSKMTFTHQMSRLILLEQIYRLFTLINNEKYHH